MRVSLLWRNNWLRLRHRTRQSDRGLMSMSQSHAKINDVTWMTGGPQGSGVDSSASIFAGACVLGGLWTFGLREYYSSIKGPHSYFEVRVNDNRIMSHVNEVDLLATFDAETLIRHAEEVSPGGGIIYDPTFANVEVDKVDTIETSVALRIKNRLEKQGLSPNVQGLLEEAKRRGINIYPIAYSDLIAKTAAQIGEHQISKVSRIINVLAVAASLALLGLDLKYLNLSVERTFASKKKIVDMNEIGAITMATGAALAGARSATSTSGPGFSLMVEGLGWAGMNEVPVVITHYQRGGPATGLPTRHEQGDLKFVLSAAHGEFPRIVLCSGDMEECFYDAIRILNYAERFQMPAIHLIDKSLANNSTTIPPPRADMIPIERGKLIQEGTRIGDGEEYRRFAFVEDGVSPRAVLGTPGYRFWNTGDEHNEIGHIEEDPENRTKMMTKRMTKLETAAKEIPEEEKLNFFKSAKPADVTVVSWGSTKGPILDAIKLLERDGVSVDFLQIRLVNPFPTAAVQQRLFSAKLLVDIEQNYSGQLAAVIAEKALIEIKNKIVKFNGRPMSRDEVYLAIRQILSNPEANRRVVLTHGA